MFSQIAGTDGAKEMNENHTIEDLISLRKFSCLTSTDGYVGFIDTVNHSTKNSPAESMISILRKGDKKAVFTKKAKSKVSFDMLELNPEGKAFAFFESDGDTNILNTGQIGKGETQRLILNEKPSQICWAGNSLLLIMKEPVPDGKQEEALRGNDGFFFDEDERYSSIYRYQPETGFSKLTEGIQVWELSARNEKIAFVGSDHPGEESWYQSRLYVMDLRDNSCSALYDPEPRTLTRPRFSPDGRKLAFLESHWSDRGVTSGDVIILDFEKGEAVNATEGIKRSFTDVSWVGSRILSALFQEAEKFGISLFDGSWKDLWASAGSIQPNFAPEFCYDGKDHLMAFSSSRKPPEIYTVSSEGVLTALTKKNERLEKLKMHPYEVVHWRSGDGTEIQGILRCENPEDPLIVHVHGGPTSSSTVDFIDYSTVYMGHGFSVFMPNYRGSTGFGREFAESNIGDMGGGDLEDILSGVEHLKKSGKIITDRIFITGGSYGGYITNLAVTRTDIFSAAAGLFGMSDWTSFHGTTGIATWDTLYYKKSVYDKDPPHLKYDPLRFVDKINTPLLLIHGVSDPVVPVGQSHELQRALKEKGKPVRLLLFPREGHGFRERYHRIMMMDEMIKWFRKFS